MTLLKEIPSVKHYVTTKKYVEDSKELIEGFQAPPRALLFGIENEIGPYSNALVAEIRYRMGRYVAVDEDTGAVEVTSPPLTYDDSMDYLDCLYADGFENADPKQQDNWGMHIHINRGACTGEHLRRLLNIVCDPKAKKIMAKIADRPTTHGYGELPSMIQYQAAVIRYHLFAKDWIQQGIPHGMRRYGVHINSRHGTHEFRLFRSTLDVDKAKSNIQSVKSLVDFTRANEGDIASWLTFIKENPEKYPQLSSWTAKQKLN